MAADLTNFAQRVLEASGATERELPLPQIIATIPQALPKLSDRAAAEPDWSKRQFLIRTFATQAIANGNVDLTTLLAAAKPPVLQYHRLWEIYADNISGKIQMVTDLSNLNLDKPPGYGFGCVSARTLYINDGSGTPYAGNAVITGLFVLGIDDVLNELDDELIEIVLSILKPTAAAA